jgi:trimethylamine--corrinoid protein Co-methyltransferase
MHVAALQLLERAGVRVESAAARGALEAAGCRPGAQDRLTMPAEVVDAAVSACPREYVLTARANQWSLGIDPEPGPTYVHNLGGAANVVEPHTGELRRATLRDQAQLARVMHRLRNQHTLTPLVQPGDVPAPLEPLYSYLVLAHESDKYLGGPGIASAIQGRYLQQMAVTLTGVDGAGGRYPLDLAFSPVSPLLLSRDVGDALVDACRRGGVVIEILPCPAAATTAPAAISAAVAQQHAEVLAGVVLAQAVAPGTPVYYGPRLSAVDPRTGAVLSGTGETGVASIAATLLARRCGLACDCYGPCSDSKVIDAQFGYERAVNALLGLVARPRLLSGIGEIQAGVATCLEALVLDDDVLENAFYCTQPRPWDPEVLDVQAMIDGALSDGGFLAAKHTRRYLRREMVRPQVSYRGGLREWLDAGHGGVVDLASARARQLTVERPVGLPTDVSEALCGLIDVAARELGLAEWPDPRAVIESAL